MADNPPGSGTDDDPPGQPAGPPGGAPGHGYPQTDGTATAALAIAIVGIFVCLPVGAIVALLLANGAIRRIQASGGRLTGLDQARAARRIAIIELVLVAALVALGVALAAVAVNNDSTTATTTIYAPAP
jgi:hypothetical protein